MTQSVQLAIYAGSFDPPTNGHLDLVDRASRLFPRLIVAVGKNPTRAPLFDPDARIEMMREICQAYSTVVVDSVEGLLVDYG